MLDVALELTALAACAALGLALVRWLAFVDRATRRRTYELVFPRTITPAQATAAVRSIGGLLPRRSRRWPSPPEVVLEAVATHSGIRHFVSVAGHGAGYAVGQLRAALPGVRVSEVERRAVPELDLARELRVAGRGKLRTDAPEAISAGVLASLQPLREDEVVAIQWILVPVASSPILSSTRTIAEALRGPDQSEHERRSRELEPQLHATGRVGVAAPEAQRRDALIAQLLGSLHASGSPEASLRRRLLPSALVGPALAAGRPPLLVHPAVLRADELAALVGIPIDGPQLRGLVYVGARELPPVASIPRTGRVLGHAITDPDRSLAIDPAESTKGVYALAPTGGGKSTLLANLILQDVAAGRPVVVVESKGDLVADICDRIGRRLDDVIVFDPADADRPLGFNLLQAGEAGADLVVDHVVGTFKGLYRSYLGPRSEDLLRASFTTLAADPEATLCDVPRLLLDETWRTQLLAAIDDPVLGSVWSWFGGLSEAARSEVTAPLMNKLRAFTLRRRLRNVIGQPESAIDFEAALRERKILLISLAKGVIGEDAAALLGSAMLARLWQAIAARAALPAAERALAFVYCDEAQDFLRLPVALGDAIAQSRGYNVGWTISHQHLAQLSPDLRQACLANLRSKVVLQTTASDAATLAREFAPHLSAQDLQGLGHFEAYAAVSTGPAVAPPASIKTLPPPPSVGSAAAVRQRSRERFGRDVREVEANLRARAEGSAPGVPIGRRRRT